MPSSNFRSHKLFTAISIFWSCRQFLSKQYAARGNSWPKASRAHHKGTELQIKNLEMGLLSVYITNCLSSFWAHYAKTNNDIILFLNDPLGLKPFNNTSVVGECNVILVECGGYFDSMQTYITCTGNFLSYRQNKCIFLSEKQAPFVFQANEDWCEFHFFKPSSSTLFS